MERGWREWQLTVGKRWGHMESVGSWWVAKGVCEEGMSREQKEERQ